MQKTTHALGAALFLVALILASWASADHDPWSPRLRGLVTMLSFNEALDSIPDAALIWQVAEGHGDTARQRFTWLRSHSRCVSGVLTQDQAYARPGNCRWTRNLHPDGRRPRGWDRQLHGHWSRTRPRWLAHVRDVRAVMRSSYRPCPVTPDTWDGVRYGRERVAPDGGPREIVECEHPYTSDPGEKGLHNFAVRVLR